MNVTGESDFNIDLLRFNQLNVNQDTSKIFYGSKNGKLYLLCNGLILNDCALNSMNSTYCIDLQFKNKGVGSNAIKQIDDRVVEYLLLNSSSWFGDDMAKIQIEYDFIRSLRMQNEQISNLISLSSCSDVKFYDQDGLSIPFELISNKLKCSAILSVDNLSRSSKNNCLRLNWKVCQLRVFIPNVSELTPEIRECQVNTDGDEDDFDFDLD
jgi:hypothetical protein